MAVTIQDKIQFVQMAGELSPENLFADGERSAKQAAKVKSNIQARWKALEKSIGRKVSEDQAWSFSEDVTAYQEQKRADEIAKGPNHPLVAAKNPGVWIREGNDSTAYYIWGPPRGSTFTLFSEFAYRIVGKKEKIGEYDTLEAAVVAGEDFLATITYDLVKQRNPLWAPETIKRELLRRLPGGFDPQLPTMPPVTSFILRFGEDETFEGVSATEIAEIIAERLIERGQHCSITSA